MSITTHLCFSSAEYPGVISTRVIGQSYEGRDMIMLSFCQGQCGENPIMWIDSG